jgi:hypothetical protein
MNTAIQRRTKSTRRLLSAVAVFAATTLMFMPTQASAFDIGGLVGAAISMQMGHYRGGYSGGHSHHVASHNDSDSSDHGNTGVERDARDPDTTTPSAGKSDNGRVAVRTQKTQGPSGANGGTAQASEHDAAAGQIASAGKSFDDAPAFNPSR